MKRPALNRSGRSGLIARPGGEERRSEIGWLAEIPKLVGGPGYLDLAAYDRTVVTQLSGGSEPVITRRLIGAWTRAIWQAARRYRK